MNQPDCVVVSREAFKDMQDRIRLLTDIALSAVALKLNIEHGFEPHLNALNRDLAAHNKRFGGIILEPKAVSDVKS